jgi:hypothetical protein
MLFNAVVSTAPFFNAVGVLIFRGDPLPLHGLVDFVVLPPGHGSSVTDSEVGTAMRRSYVVPMM